MDIVTENERFEISKNTTRDFESENERFEEFRTVEILSLRLFRRYSDFYFAICRQIRRSRRDIFGKNKSTKIVSRKMKEQ